MPGDVSVETSDGVAVVRMHEAALDTASRELRRADAVLERDPMSEGWISG